MLYGNGITRLERHQAFEVILGNLVHIFYRQPRYLCIFPRGLALRQLKLDFVRTQLKGTEESNS